MSEATDLVDAQVAAYGERDLERFLGFYAEDVKVGDFDGNVLMDGTASMRELYGVVVYRVQNGKIREVVLLR